MQYCLRVMVPVDDKCILEHVFNSKIQMLNELGDYLDIVKDGYYFTICRVHA